MTFPDVSFNICLNLLVTSLVICEAVGISSDSCCKNTPFPYLLVSCCIFFYNFFWEDTSPFCDCDTDTLFWTFGDVCPGFQSQGGTPHLHTLPPTHNGFFRFTSGAPPADTSRPAWRKSRYNPRKHSLAILWVSSCILRNR